MSVCRVQLNSGGYIVVPGTPAEVRDTLQPAHPTTAYAVLTDTLGNEAHIRQDAVEAVWELPHWKDGE